MRNTKNGFTLIETLASLFIVSSLFVLSINKINMPSIIHHYFIDDYLYIQAKALTSYNHESFRNDYSKYEIYFNDKGGVNQGQSFYVGSRLVVIRPGTGYIRYE